MKRLGTFSTLPRIALIAVAVGVVPVAFALVSGGDSVASTTQYTIEEAIAFHDAAKEGDSDATAKAVEAFKSLTQAHETDPLAVVYLGSSYAMTARDAGSVTDKIRFTNRGLRYLDQAVTMAPDDFVVRLVRANVISNLPAMFGRDEMVVDDMIWLDRAYTAAHNPRMAAPMARIYSELNARAPERGDWQAKLSAVKSIVAGN